MALDDPLDEKNTKKSSEPFLTRLSKLIGIPVKVISDAEAVSSRDPIICGRVQPDLDMAQQVPGSDIRQCSLCQSNVLCSPATQQILAQGKNDIVCMECWTQAQQPAMNEPAMDEEDRADKLRRLELCKQFGEKAYDDMYEKAHSPSDASAYYSDAKESFYTAIGLARELGLQQEVEALEKRLDHIKSVFRSQF